MCVIQNCASVWVHPTSLAFIYHLKCVMRLSWAHPCVDYGKRERKGDPRTANHGILRNSTADRLINC
jgi:hypothetical protein